jgi:hypothetical protein
MNIFEQLDPDLRERREHERALKKLRKNLSPELQKQLDADMAAVHERINELMLTKNKK